MGFGRIITRILTAPEIVDARESIAAQAASLNGYLQENPDNIGAIEPLIRLGWASTRTDRKVESILGDNPYVLSIPDSDHPYYQAMQLGRDILNYQLDFKSWENSLGHVLSPLLQTLGYKPREFFEMLVKKGNSE